MRDARFIEPGNDYEAWLREFDRRDIDASEARSMWALKYRSRLQRLLAALDDLPAGASVLEVGASQANASLLAAERGLRAVALDREWRALAYARKKHEHGDFTAVCAEAERLPLRDETFEAVLAPEVLEHLPDPAQALREMWRVLQPEGLLVVTTPNGDWERRRPKTESQQGAGNAGRQADAAGHVRTFTLGELRGLLEGSGFELVLAGYEGSVIMSDRLRLNRLLPPAMTTKLSGWLNRLPGSRWWSYNCFVIARKH